MRFLISSLLFLILISVNCLSVSAQDQNTYTVQKGEGLYRISVKLGTTMEELLKANPSIKNGVSEGQVIQIPASAIKKMDANLNKSGEGDFILHTVEKGQTLYALSQKYDVPIEILIQNNAGVENGLVEGSVVKIPKETQIGSGPKKRSSDYKYHTIAPKETLYGISKVYNCTVDDIIEANPGLTSAEMKIGNEIRIPTKSSSSASTQVNAKIDAPTTVKGDYYVIKKRDRLSGLAKQFSLSEDEIRKANPAIDFAALKVGMTIVIPKSSNSTLVYGSQSADELSDEKILAQSKKENCGGYKYTSGTVFKIALLLPFAAKENLTTPSNESQSVSLSTVSKIFLEYYEGTLMALDRLKREGVSVECFVYDTWPDSTKIKQILAKPEMKQMNVIFGPAYAVNLQQVSDFAKANQIPLVYPLSSKNYEIQENPYLFHINSADSLLYDNVATYLASQNNAKVIVVTSQSPSIKERDIIARVKKFYQLQNENRTNKNSWVEIPYSTENGFDKLLPQIDASKDNLIFIPSEKESDVSLIVNGVNGNLKKSSASISVIGMPEWLKYQTINTEDIHATNTYVFARAALDYYSPQTQTFVKEYRMLYKSEPLAFSPYFQYGGKNPNYSRYGILGYDLTYYFISALKEYGPKFQFCLKGFNPPLIQSNFIFKRIGNWGGFYDDGLFLVHFRPDYKIERISLH